MALLMIFGGYIGYNSPTKNKNSMKKYNRKNFILPAKRKKIY